MTRLRSRVALTIVAGLLLAACGSTTKTSDRAAVDGGRAGAATTGAGTGLPGSATPGGGLAPSGVGGPAGSSTGSSTFDGSGAGAGSAGGTASGTAGTTGDTTSGSTGGAVTAAGPGVTATEVRIGIGYCNDCATANATIGASGQDPGDTRRYFQAAIDDVNSRGGVLGRKLVPVFQQVSASDNIDSSAQAACEKFTKDTKVAAFAFRGEIAAACGLKAGVMVLGSSSTGPTFNKFPNLFAPASIRLEGLHARAGLEGDGRPVHRRAAEREQHRRLQRGDQLGGAVVPAEGRRPRLHR